MTRHGDAYLVSPSLAQGDPAPDTESDSGGQYVLADTPMGPLGHEMWASAPPPPPERRQHMEERQPPVAIVTDGNTAQPPGTGSTDDGAEGYGTDEVDGMSTCANDGSGQSYDFPFPAMATPFH